MNLVKWFRKNKTKVMAVVVIILMFAFVGGSYLRQLGRRRRTQLHKTVAYFRDKEITNYDLRLAQRELEILKMLQADVILRNIKIALFDAPDLHSLLLSELLFSSRRTSAVLSQQLKQLIRANEYRISDKQINDIYRRSMGHDIDQLYWLLLTKEAQLAGIRIPNGQSGKMLATAIPQLFNGVTYPQLIGPIINRQAIPEKEILTTFSKLIAVLEYAKTICLSEGITAQQIMHTASWEGESLDAEFVKFDSAVFADTQEKPSEEEIAEHFEKYKKFFAGTVSEENPYGFGYELADRVQLEYIAVKLDDVSQIVTAPAEEQAEEYYQKHREQLFTEQVPSDPNDPNSPPTERIKSYAEVASDISDLLLQNKINSKAEAILQEAKTLTEPEDTEPEALSTEEMKQATGNYEATAEELTKKYKVTVYAGQTGLLSAADIQADQYLPRLYLTGYGYNPVGLARIVFSIEHLDVSELGPFDVPKPRMHENIGPLKDALGQIMVVVRIVKAEKASEPENINQSYSKDTLIFERDQQKASESAPEPDEGQSRIQDVYSVKEEVAEDLKKLAAMKTTKTKAEEFINLAVKDGWDSTIDKFNQLYRQQDTEDETDPDMFRLQNLTNLRRISRKTIGMLTVQSEGSPAAQLLVNNYKKETQLRNQLYSLVPQDSNTVDTVPLIMEFKPDMSYYCLKNISVRRLNQDEYERMKVLRAYKEDIVQSQSLAAVHFNPENILKRMDFRWTKQEQEQADANAPAESKGNL